jgi:hypothetical protein
VRRWGMHPRPVLVVPPPDVQRLPDGRYLALSARFTDLWAIERSADAAAFVLRLLVQKRLYGQRWRWGAPNTDGDDGESTAGVAARETPATA